MTRPAQAIVHGAGDAAAPARLAPVVYGSLAILSPWIFRSLARLVFVAPYGLPSSRATSPTFSVGVMPISLASSSGVHGGAGALFRTRGAGVSGRGAGVSVVPGSGSRCVAARANFGAFGERPPQRRHSRACFGSASAGQAPQRQHQVYGRTTSRGLLAPFRGVRSLRASRPTARPTRA